MILFWSRSTAFDVSSLGCSFLSAWQFADATRPVQDHIQLFQSPTDVGINFGELTLAPPLTHQPARTRPQ